MSVIFECKGNEPMVWYKRIQMTGLYLQSARKSAASALAITDDSERLEERIELAILAVIWSTLALEAGANQIAEDVFSNDNLGDFDFCRKAFQKPPKVNVSRTVWKWHKLFAEGPKVAIPLSDPLLIAAEGLMQARHLLSHYRPQHTSQKIYYQPGPYEKGPDGMYHREWNAKMTPIKVEPSLVEKELLADKPREHFLAAWNIFRKWELSYGTEGSNLEKAVPPL